jgi:GNAT superfamily N-acetyltransferase
MPTAVREAATELDRQFIAERFEETVALWEDYEVTADSVAKRLSQVDEWLADEKMHLTVAVTSDDEPVGFNSLYLTKDYDGKALGKIVIMYVLPEHRRSGIARRLKLEGEAWLRAKGATQVTTEIDAKNERMLDISKKAGFRIKSHTFVREL